LCWHKSEAHILSLFVDLGHRHIKSARLHRNRYLRPHLQALIPVPAQDQHVVQVNIHEHVVARQVNPDPSIAGSVHQKHTAYAPTQMLASSYSRVDDRKVDGK